MPQLSVGVSFTFAVVVHAGVGHSHTAFVSPLLSVSTGIWCCWMLLSVVGCWVVMVAVGFLDAVGCCWMLLDGWCCPTECQNSIDQHPSTTNNINTLLGVAGTGLHALCTEICCGGGSGCWWVGESPPCSFISTPTGISMGDTRSGTTYFFCNSPPFLNTNTDTDTHTACTFSCICCTASSRGCMIIVYLNAVILIHVKWFLY